VEELSNVLCGKSRPGHFRGVTTVVLKLLNIVSPDVMYLGQKDAQQAVIIKKTVENLNVPVKIKVLPTIREKDGVAMSSRNSYLDANQRRQATILFKALTSAKNMILSGERDSQKIVETIRHLIESNTTSSRIDYIECVDRETLRPVTVLSGGILIALAVWFGQTRLIDNTGVRVS
jgi:pantoate--beta-alanine ligase